MEKKLVEVMTKVLRQLIWEFVCGGLKAASAGLILMGMAPLLFTTGLTPSQMASAVASIVIGLVLVIVLFVLMLVERLNKLF